MTDREHRYTALVEWTGNTGEGTTGYKSFERAHEISASGKPTIPGSSDPTFRGDRNRWNPEEMLVASLSTCHMLWYLHLCAAGGVVVTSYLDRAEGTMVEDASGGGRFADVILKPEVEVTAASDLEAARRLHMDAHSKCFIANSVNFPVSCEPAIRQQD